MVRRLFVLIVLIAVSIQFNSCGRSKTKKIFNTNPVSVKQYNTPPGADITVSAEWGGIGFTGEGWESGVEYNSIASPDAYKGGSFTIALKDFPITLRMVGKDASLQFNRMSGSLLYEGLIQLDPVTDEYSPMLATHWQISQDWKTYRFRINPDARWADGKPVISEDVVETWKLYVDPGILSPYYNEVFNTFEQPVAESKYIVSVKSKVPSWRQFIYFATSNIYPSHIIGGLKGSEYLEKFQFGYLVGSGPYLIDQNDIKKNESVTLRRRSDYWAENLPFSKGKNNFDLIKFDFIKDENLEFEKFKKGEIDFFSVNRSQIWNEKFDFDEVKRGLVERKQVYNEYPRGINGIVFNMRIEPFNDVRIRKAFCYLYDRKKFNERLFFNSYKMLSSFFPGTVYENPANPVIGFNPDSASTLLKEAGWTEKNAEGYLVKDGKIFEVELPFQKPADRYLTLFQEDLKNAGIKLNLKELDAMTLYKLAEERNFTIITINLSGLEIPNPESMLKSSIADSLNTPNYFGIKDGRIDELCRKYGITFGINERINILREIDAIACGYYPMIFNWYPNYHRIAYLNKFGYPECMLEKRNDYASVFTLWYNDPDKYRDYESAVNNKDEKLDTEPVENRYWISKQK